MDRKEREALERLLDDEPRIKPSEYHRFTPSVAIPSWLVAVHAARSAVTTDELRALAEAAIRPCDRCELTVPHAFEEPDAHIWDPNHVTVDPHDLLAALSKEEKP